MILIVTTHSSLSGAPIHVRDLAIGLDAQGHDVSVVFGAAGVIQEQLDSAGIRTYVIPTLHSNLNPFQDIVSFFSLRSLVKQLRPKLLHLHSSKAGFIGRWVAFSLQLPAVYTIHGWGFGPGRRWYVSIIVRLIEWLCMPITKRYIAVSNVDRLLGIQQLRVPADKITTIYNATTFTPRRGVTVAHSLDLIMVARNDRQKDYDTLFRALAVSEFDTATVVGGGTNDPDFVSSSRALARANSNKLRFLGPRDDVEELLEMSSAMVLSSNFEGLPISVIEAMSKGLPIIASKVGGLPELVKNGINGFLFTTGDFNGLAEHITQLHSNPAKRSIMGQESLKLFERHFDLPSMVKKTLNEYRIALE